jgi:uncharacterized protein with HEPN domain
MDNRAKKLLFDVIQSGRSIREWCAGRTFSDYERERQFRKAVEREFEVIGEALNRLTQADPATAGRIGDLNRIVGFRNGIIHGYDAVDDATVWGVAESHLPRLLEEVEQLLREAGESLDG